MQSRSSAGLPATPHEVPGTDARSGPPAVPPGHRQAGGPPTRPWRPADSPFQMWVIQGELPECVRAQLCPKCAAVVPVGSMPLHRAWHIRQETIR